MVTVSEVITQLRSYDENLTIEKLLEQPKVSDVCLVEIKLTNCCTFLRSPPHLTPTLPLKVLTEAGLFQNPPRSSLLASNRTPLEFRIVRLVQDWAKIILRSESILNSEWSVLLLFLMPNSGLL